MSLLQSFLKVTGEIKVWVDSIEETELRFWLGSDIRSVSLGVERVIHIAVRRVFLAHSQGLHDTEVPGLFTCNRSF